MQPTASLAVNKKETNLSQSGTFAKVFECDSSYKICIKTHPVYWSPVDHLSSEAATGGWDSSQAKLYILTKVLLPVCGL